VRQSVCKLEGERPLDRYRHSYGDNITVDLRDIVCGVDWTEVA